MSLLDLIGIMSLEIAYLCSKCSSVALCKRCRISVVNKTSKINWFEVGNIIISKGMISLQS